MFKTTWVWFLNIQVWFLLRIWVWLRGQRLEELILLQGLQFRRNPYIESASGARRLSLGVGPKLGEQPRQGQEELLSHVLSHASEMRSALELDWCWVRWGSIRSKGWGGGEGVTPSSASNSGDNGKKARAIPGNLGPILRKKCHYPSPLATATSFYSSVAPYFLRNHYFSTWRGPYIPILSLKREESWSPESNIMTCHAQAAK